VDGDRLSGLLAAQPHAKAVLGAVADGRAELSHAYLITGPGGSGKAELAVELAAAALAAASADGAIAPAGVDAELRGRVERRVHPDLAWVVPTSGAGILVEDVERQILEAAGATPLVASRRVFVIEQVERLNESAANRLLKTIEEPPPYVHLLLLSSHPGQVMATIASRCQRVRMQGRPQGEVVARLEQSGVPSELAHSAVRLAGADGDLAALLADPELGAPLRAAAEQFAIGALRGGVTAPWQPLLDRATAAGQRAAEAVGEEAAGPLEHLEGRDKSAFEKVVDERSKRASRQARTAELDAALMLTGTWLRDLWVLALGAGDTIRGVDRQAALGALLEELAPGERERRQFAARLAEGIAAVQEARAALVVNASEGLLLDALTVRLTAIGHGAPVPA
jgi:DNA polymerase-3 subunit delta'